MTEIEILINDIQKEAERESFPIDDPVYQAAGLIPTQPILYAGNLHSQVCFFARDLGKDEVFAQQPLIGSAGKLVRQGLYRVLFNQEPDKNDDLTKVLDYMVLTNTVPYKPPGNKAYSEGVKKRFRPFLERFLVLHWQGDTIITLGNEAFNWYIPYGKKGELKDFFAQGDRYSLSISVTLTAQDLTGKVHEKSVKIMPLPHPSPLNQKYYALFPQLLSDLLRNAYAIA
jgi:uracil-DNA glycosylase